MGQDERTPRILTEHEPTRRLSLFDEEYDEEYDEKYRERLELPSPPPWTAAYPGSGRRSQRHARSRRRGPTAAAGLIGLTLGVATTLLVTRETTQQTIMVRDARIAQLTSEFDQARAEQREVSARSAALVGREATLKQREQELDGREATLVSRETALKQREQEPDDPEAAPARRQRELVRRETAPKKHVQPRVQASGVDLPDSSMAGDILGHFGPGVQDLFDKALSGR